MTEYNYFCWSTKYNDENSLQQARYRVFNVEVAKEEYNKIKKIYHALKFNTTEDYNKCYQSAFKKMWNKLSQEEKQEYLDIPHFNWKGFTYITGITQDDMQEVEELTIEEISERLGKTVKIKK